MNNGLICIKLADVADRLPVPPRILGKFQQHYDELYEWICSNFQNREKFKKNAVYKINLLTYFLVEDGDVPSNWLALVAQNELHTDIHSGTIQRTILNCMLYVDNIDWSECVDSSVNNASVDVCTASDADSAAKSNKTRSVELGSGETGVSNYSFVAKTHEGANYSGQTKQMDTQPDLSAASDNAVDDEYEQLAARELTEKEQTPKEDLFITVPKYPKIGNMSDLPNDIRVSLPIAPSKQCEISATTRLSDMSEADLLNLFPKQFIRTRSPLMYESRKGITLDPLYGLLIPVEGFTDAQVRDCIIRYPHIFQLARQDEDGNYRSFYNELEIDGELVNVLKVWQYLPEAKIIDINSLSTRKEQIEFIKEYVIRRYLLERDVAGVQHKYDVRGSLPEFMTLFMPADMYADEGYDNALSLARTCVRGRISYLKTRNPRIVGEKPTVADCMFSPYCCATLCDRSCPKWALTDYLLMRNGLSYSSRPFKMKQSSLDNYIEVYNKAVQSGKALTVTCKDPVKVAEVMSYIAVCNTWNGSAMRVKCYHLLYSQYLESIQSSFGGRLNDDTAYAELWAKSCNVLVISGIDYVNFKDFQSQKILQLLQDRERKRKATIIVGPKVENIMGSGKMYDLLLTKFRSNLVAMD